MEKKPVPKAVEKGLNQQAVAEPDKTEKQLQERESTSKLHIETTRPSETKAVITVEINDVIFKAERDKLLSQEQVKQDALKDQITSLQQRIQQLEKSEKDLQSKHEAAQRESKRLNILAAQKEEIVKKAMVKETELNGRIASLQKEYHQLRKSETELQSKHETARQESESLKLLVAQREESVKQASAKETELKAEIASLQKENQQLRKSEKDLRSQNQTLHDLATKLQKQVAEKEEIAKKASSKHAGLEGCIASLQKEIEERKKTEIELKSRNQTLLESETKLKKSVAEKDELIKNCNRKELTTLNALESLKKQIEDIGKSEKDLRAKNGHLLEELEEVNNQRKKVDAEIRKQQTEKISANREIRILNQREENVFFIIQQLARKIASLKEESSDGHIATSKMKVTDYSSIMRDLKHKASNYNKEELWSWLQVSLQLVHEPSLLVLKESEKLVATAAPERMKREPEIKPKKPHTASIDFGTCFCTWAYTEQDMGSDEEDSGLIVSKKEPTSALLNPDGKTLKAFGYEAEQTFKDLAAQRNHKDHFYFQRFKMALDKEQLSQTVELEDFMGKKLPAMTVFQVSIQHISAEVRKLSKGVNEDKKESMKDEDVQWTITVPGFWSDAAKQFMREAATKAKLDTNHVNIALDSEAAAIFCQNPSCSSDEMPTTKFEPGTRYIIIDAGGGKVDLTAHEVSETGDLKEIHAGTGHSMGSNLVNDSFNELLENVFGKEVIDAFKKEEPVEWITLSDEFEDKKRSFQPRCEHVEINIPSSVYERFEVENEIEISCAVQAGKYASDIKLNGNKMVITATLMKKYFAKPVEETIAQTKTIISKIGPVDVIFMVGGFSASPMLQIPMKAAFADTEIINRDGNAVAAGAIIVGPNPHLITQRVLKKTYGIEAMVWFSEDSHPVSRKTIIDGQPWVKKVFNKHVEKGQTVAVGEIQKEEYYNPFYKDQPNISFHVFASDDKDPKYTDEGCMHIGQVTLDISDVPGDMEREIAVNLTFDESEIKVKARVLQTGKEVIGRCNFLG